MASSTSAGGRGRRKQAKPQRKQVELDNLCGESTMLTEVPTTTASMSPDTNHNDQISDNHPKELFEKRMNGGILKEAAIPERLTVPNNGSVVQETTRMCKTGGAAEDVPRESVSTKAAVGEQQEEDEKIQEYLQRSDTAVIFAEPVGQAENVPALTNGLSKEGEVSGSEYFIKCPQCQKGCPSFQALKEHIEVSHTAGSEERLADPSPRPVSPPPSLVGPGGPFACSQCTTSFASKDQLEKHELLHSPNAQVSCKICNKTFANVYRLQRHMISHDESAVLRKFKCTECEKAFKFKHHLKEHIRIHSGEKPFECGNCGKRFSHSGSYSSHMTSKKCLVMNLKLGRNRANSANTLLDKNQSLANRSSKRPSSNMNNNITTSPNHNTYLPILPKYSEAAAAFLQTSLVTNPGIHPFYMTPPGLLNSSGHAISPYSIPASLGHLLEQLQSASSPQRPPLLDHGNETNTEDLNRAQLFAMHSPKLQQTKINEIKSDSSCGELVMDEDVDEMEGREKVPRITNGRESPEVNSNSGDLEAVKRILETVNATVTKQFLQANMQKLSSESSSGCPSVASPSPSGYSQGEFSCAVCKKQFNHQTALDEHECDQYDVKSEGLAAKLEEAVNVKSEDTMNGNLSCSEDGREDDRLKCKVDDYEMDSESVTTTDHVSEDGRKVRVRSLIADEQLTVLKDNYTLNPRPKREELVRIAEKIGFPVRVVQVWFQNTRARDRREGRLVHVPYSPIPPLSLNYTQTLVPSNSQIQTRKIYPITTSPQYTSFASEQPLDLSTKKESQSTESSPSSSPQRPMSAAQQSDSGEDVVNLSHKSSRSPTPFRQLPHYANYQSSNCSSDLHRSPSPVNDFNNGSRLARMLAQPQKLAMTSMGLVPIDRLMQSYSPSDFPSFNHLISNRISSMSPNSEKRSWNDTEESTVSQEVYPHDEDNPLKRNKVSQLVLKSLGSPMLSNPEPEIEGQFICDQCDKAFSKQSSLARHKYEHSGQRPHKCDECPKAFKHKHHLTEHKRLHSGEKPFQCSKCLKRFSHSGSYSQHMNHRYSYCKPYRE